MRKILSAVLCVAFAGPALAEQEVYLCNIDTDGRNWILPEIAIGMNEDKIVVYDGFIDTFNKKRPVAARMTEDSAKKRVFSWDLKLHVRGQSTKMAYRAAMFKSNGDVIVTAKPHGYSNRFSARGRCALSDFKLPAS